MEGPIILAIALAIPIILFPAAFIWYLNIGGMYAAAKRARQRRTAATNQTPFKGEERSV